MASQEAVRRREKEVPQQENPAEGVPRLLQGVPLLLGLHGSHLRRVLRRPGPQLVPDGAQHPGPLLQGQGQGRTPLRPGEHCALYSR